MDWKTVNERAFKKVRRDFFILKTMNTRCLVTEPSDVLILDGKIQLGIHSLPTTKDVIIGYEIQTLYSFPLILISKDHLLFGSFNLKPCVFKLVFEDKHLKILKARNHDFLLCYCEVL